MSEQISPSLTSSQIVDSIQKRLKESDPKIHTSSIFQDILVLDGRARTVRAGGLRDFPVLSQYLQALSEIDWLKSGASNLPPGAESERLKLLLGIPKKHKNLILSKRNKALIGLAALGSIFTPLEAHITHPDPASHTSFLADQKTLPIAPPFIETEIEQESAPQKETKKNMSFGFRVTSPEDIISLPDSIGLIRIGGDSNLMYPDGHFHHNPDHLYSEMLSLADRKGLDVVFTYKNSNPNTPEDIVNNHIKAIARHSSVKLIEIGNEIDDSNFWEGDMEDYADLFLKADKALKSLKQQDPQIKSELVISSFADPMGTQNNGKSEQYFKELTQSLKTRGIDTKDYLIAGHAYHLETLEWLIKKLREKTDTRGIIITEFGTDDPKEFESMTSLLLTSHTPALVHEFNNNDNPRTKNKFSINPTDKRFKIFMSLLNNSS